ncbi:hypothetical protein LTS17_009928 [Exophiala oligosperma]
MVKYTSAVLASAALATTVVANGPVCSVVTEVVTGDWYWVADPTWADWAATTTTTKPAKKTTTTPAATWADWDTTTTVVDPTWVDWDTTTTKKPAPTTTVVDPTWVDWDTTTTTKKPAPTTTTWVDPTWLDWTTTTTTVKTTTTTWVDPTWLDWTSTSAAPTTTTTTTPANNGWGTTTTTVAATTTTAAPVAAATCPADNGQSVTAGGSCQCDYTVNCGVHADTSGGPQFWNKGTTDSLAACLTLCDNNDKCTATIWCDDTTQCGSDYHVCWQTNGLGGVAGTGFVLREHSRGS